MRFDFDRRARRTASAPRASTRSRSRAGRSATPRLRAGALEIQLDRLERGQGGRVFWKPFYRRSDFDDERYRPMFTPVVDAGQTVSFKLWLDPWNGDGNLRVAPYVRRTMSGAIEEIGRLGCAVEHAAGRTIVSSCPRATRRSTRWGFPSSISGGSNIWAGCSWPISRSAGAGKTMIDPAPKCRNGARFRASP